MSRNISKTFEKRTVWAVSSRIHGDSFDDNDVMSRLSVSLVEILMITRSFPLSWFEEHGEGRIEWSWASLAASVDDGWGQLLHRSRCQEYLLCHPSLPSPLSHETSLSSPLSFSPLCHFIRLSPHLFLSLSLSLLSFRFNPSSLSGDIFRTFVSSSRTSLAYASIV